MDLSALQAELLEIKNTAGIIEDEHSGDTGRLRTFHKIHEAISYYFDLDELHNFMVGLGIDPENRKPYDSKSEQSLDFVLYMNRKGRFIELIRALKESRGHVPWMEIVKNG